MVLANRKIFWDPSGSVAGNLTIYLQLRGGESGEPKSLVVNTSVILPVDQHTRMGLNEKVKVVLPD